MPVLDAHGRQRRYLYRHNPKTRPAKVCAHCGGKFQHRSANKYCSRECSSRARIVTKIDLVCLVCGEDYQSYPYRAEASKYCSKACWRQRAPRVPCLACGHIFPASGNIRKYCSRKCAHQHMVGERAAQWKGGVSFENERARHSAELREWRLAVYRRDGFRCQDCGAKGYLHAHHIKFWSTHPELRFEVSNGKTLCVDCHGRVHGRDLRRFTRSSSSKKHRRPE